MNVFTTDHPMVSAPRWNSTARLMLSYCGTALLLACLLFPLFLGLAWLGLAMGDTPDVPDLSWADPILDSLAEILGFMMAFPSFLFLEENGPFVIGIALNSLFWAYSGVAGYRTLSRHFQKKRAGS